MLCKKSRTFFSHVQPVLFGIYSAGVITIFLYSIGP